MLQDPTPKAPREPSRFGIFSRFQFMKVLGNGNLSMLLHLAKTDPIAELFLSMLNTADEIDLKEPAVTDGLSYFLLTGNLSQEEHDRILTGVYAPPQDVYIPTPNPNIMSRYKFMQLVGTVNLVTLITEAKTDPLAEVFWVMLQNAEEIDLEEPSLADGLAYFVAQEKMTQAEADRILAGTPLSV